MNPIDILKAPHVGLRELKANISSYAHQKKPIVATDHGKPIKVFVSYNDMVSLLEMIRDLLDAKMTSVVRGGRKAIAAGSRGIPARKTLDRLK